MIDSRAPLGGSWVGAGHLTGYPFPTHEEESVDASSAFISDNKLCGALFKGLGRSTCLYEKYGDGSRFRAVRQTRCVTK